MPEPERAYDDVLLRATKEGNSVVVRLTRGMALLRRVELEAEGWRVQIEEVDASRQPPR